MTDTNNPKPRRSWIKPLLAVSLACNLLVAGAVAGAFMRDKGPRGEAMRGGGPTGMVFLQALDRSERRSLMREGREAHRAIRSERGAVDREILDALKADTLDRVAIADLLARQSDAAAATRGTLQSLWLDRVEAMSTSDRGAYIARVEDIMQRRAQRRAKRQDD